MPLSYRGLAARGAPRSSQSTLGPFWHQKKRFDVPSGEEIEFELWFHATSPSGATAFIGKELRLRIELDVVGQPEQTSDFPIARITGPVV